MLLHPHTRRATVARHLASSRTSGQSGQLQLRYPAVRVGRLCGCSSLSPRMLLLTSCLLHRCGLPRAPPALACASGLPPLDAAFVESLHGTATGLHTEQCEQSVESFDTGSWQGEGVAYALSEGDYVTHTVSSDRLTGPDAQFITGGAHIHQTRQPVLSDAEVDALKAEASAAMEAGLTSGYDQLSRASANLGEVRTVQLPEARAWLTTRLADTIFPMLSERFGIDQSSLRIHDSLIIHYDAAQGAASQVTHRDASLLSVNIALSQRGLDYEGGGTFFEGLRDDHTNSLLEAPHHAGEATSSQSSILTLDKGHCMCHASGLRHAGHRITSGERWVLVVFVLATHVTHAPRRLADGAEATALAGNLPQAMQMYRACVALDPNDDELHYGLSRCYAQMGQSAMARASLVTALSLYPPSPKLQVAGSPNLTHH